MADDNALDERRDRHLRQRPVAPPLLQILLRKGLDRGGGPLTLLAQPLPVRVLTALCSREEPRLLLALAALLSRRYPSGGGPTTSISYLRLNSRQNVPGSASAGIRIPSSNIPSNPPGIAMKSSRVVCSTDGR